MWSAPTAHPLIPCFHPAAVVFPLLLFCCSSHVEIRAFSCVTSPFLGPCAPLPLWQSVMVWLTSTPSQHCPPLASVTWLSLAFPSISHSSLSLLCSLNLYCLFQLLWSLYQVLHELSGYVFTIQTIQRYVMSFLKKLSSFPLSSELVMVNPWTVVFPDPFPCNLACLLLFNINRIVS